MEALFDVYFTAETDGSTERNVVRDGLARLFKIDANAATKLMNGDRHGIKRGCDRATALRYRDAMLKVGAKVIIERQTQNVSTVESTLDSSKTSLDTTEPADNKAPSSDALRATDGRDPASFNATEAVRGQGSAKFEAYPISNTPAKSEVVDAEKSTSARFSIDPLGTLLSTPIDQSAAKVIEIPEYGLAPAGAPIPNLPKEIPPIPPNTDQLSLQPID